MSNAAIRDAVGAAITYLSQHPKEARYTDSEATAVLDEGLGVTVTGRDGAVVRTACRSRWAAEVLRPHPAGSCAPPRRVVSRR
jgi:hypothetical protein